MKINSLPLVLLSFAAVLGVQAAQQVVVPNGLANVEGNSSMSDPFNSTSFRYQQVFDASQFAFLGSGTGRIDKIFFRIDGASTGEVLYAFGGASVVLSTTQRAPDGLSATFADNRGPDAVTIVNGAVSFGGFPVGGNPPFAFHETITAQSPFLYSPSHGNLLMELAGVFGQSFLPGSLDAQMSTADSLSRVFAESNLALSGSPDSLGLVTQFEITIVPEPPALIILCLASAIFMLGLQLSRKARRAKQFQNTLPVKTR